MQCDHRSVLASSIISSVSKLDPEHPETSTVPSAPMRVDTMMELSTMKRKQHTMKYKNKTKIARHGGSYEEAYLDLSLLKDYRSANRPLDPTSARWISNTGE